jgi:predicted TIM-barrel fold metal-dependent hydrolase
MRIIDAHSHVLRSAAHGRELWSYFLGRSPVAGFPAEPPALHTVEEAEKLMAATGVERMNILMFTWAGRYWRDGQHTLPDAGPQRAAAAEQLRRRIAQRIRDNNEWALGVVRANPRFSVFCGIDAAILTADELVAEIEQRTRGGAAGVKMVPFDSGVAGSDPRLWPVYDYCAGRGIPILSESSGRPGAPGRPANFAAALRAFPRLLLVFAHLGHDPRFGEGADLEVVELAREFEGVHTDLSLRLPEMLRGACTPEQFAAHLRRIGTGRVLYGTNFGFVDTTNADPEHRSEAGPQTTWARRTLQAFLELPLSTAEREAIAASNFEQLLARGR